jgi:hypothetical protein
VLRAAQPATNDRLPLGNNGTTMTAQTPRKISALKEWSLRLGLVMTSLLVALVLAEIVVRIALPISDRRDNITLDGQVITSFVTPGLTYRQVSSEYDVITTITDKGHRAPEVNGNPDVIFVGDSFTFGYGLGDEQTFPMIYCTSLGITCANLGLPSSGTLRQMERLEQFLTDWGWRPREVKLFFFGMSSSFSSGNDFVDNYERERRARAPQATAPDAQPQQEGGLAERVIGMQAFLLRYSNLVRVAKFYAGPLLRSLIVAEPGEERMALALEATRAALVRLDELSRREQFSYEIYLIGPVHDILRGTAADTLSTLNGLAPQPAVSTALLFTDDPSTYYFSFDGHLNPLGSRRVADFLIERSGGRPAP